MATTSNIKILHYSNNPFDRWEWPVGSSVVFAHGDLAESVSGTAGTATVVDGDDNDQFIGVVETGSATGSTTPIAVLIRCIIKGKLTADAVDAGDTVKYNAGANGTDWVFADATAEGIAWCFEGDGIAASGSGKLLIDVPRLDVGIFEVVTT